MSLEDIIGSMAKGSTKGLLEWSKEEISTLATNFRNKNVAFVGDKDEIKKIVANKKTPTYNYYKEYISDKNHLILCQMGLRLKDIENNQKLTNRLKEKIYSKYKAKGIYISLCIQNEILDFVINYFRKEYSKSDVVKIINNYLNDIEKVIYFVNKDTDPKLESKKIITLIYANKPEIYTISSYSKSTFRLFDILVKKVYSEIKTDYECATYIKNQRKIYIFTKNK